MTAGRAAVEFQKEVEPHSSGHQNNCKWIINPPFWKSDLSFYQTRKFTWDFKLKHIWYYLDPGAKPCALLCWLSLGSRRTIFWVCQGPSGWHPFLLLYQLHHSTWYHQQTCWGWPSLLQAEQAQLSQPVFIGRVLQPSDHLCGSPLDLFQKLHNFLQLGAPGLDTVLQMGPHEGRVEGANDLPHPAGHLPFDAAQDTVGLLSCRAHTCEMKSAWLLFISWWDECFGLGRVPRDQLFVYIAGLNHKGW